MRCDRRVFLRSSATTAALAATAPGLLCSSLLADEPATASRMRFGLVTYLWGADLKLPELISACEKSGALGLELRTTHKHGVERTLSREQRREVKKRFDDSPAIMVGIGSDERFDNPDPEKLKRAIAATRDFIRLSHDVGGSGVKVKPDSFHKNVPREKTIEQIGKSLNAVARFGAEHGQEIRLEVHGQCSHLPTIKQILDVADHPNVRVCWNCNDQDLQGEGLAHNFNLVKDRFGDTLHIRNLKKHGYPYDELFKLLVAADYGGWVLLEARGKLPADRAAGLREQRLEFERRIRV